MDARASSSGCRPEDPPAHALHRRPRASTSPVTFASRLPVTLGLDPRAHLPPISASPRPDLPCHPSALVRRPDRPPRRPPPDHCCHPRAPTSTVTLGLRPEGPSPPAAASPSAPTAAPPAARPELHPRGRPPRLPGRPRATSGPDHRGHPRAPTRGPMTSDPRVTLRRLSRGAWKGVPDRGLARELFPPIPAQAAPPPRRPRFAGMHFHGPMDPRKISLTMIG